MKRIKGKLMLEDEYNNLKKLCELVESNKAITNMVGRSVSTVSNVRRSKDYQDYKAKVVERYTKRKGVEATETPKTETAPIQPGDLDALIKELQDLKIAIYALRKSIYGEVVPVGDKTKKKWVFNSPFKEER